jgi:hypothetical protein
MGGKRDLVFLSDGVSFADVGGRKAERFCDPLIDHAHRCGLTTQLWTPLHRYGTPRWSTSCFVQPRIDRANALAWLEARLSGRRHAFLDGLDALRASLSGRSLPVAALEPTTLALDALRVRRVGRVYRRWLEQTRPRAAYVVCYYSLEGMAFVRACRELGILVTDLQHGVQGEAHASYAGWGRMSGAECELLPHHFWVWSPWEAAAIADGLDAPDACQPVVGGNPWLAWWRNAQSDSPIAAALAGQADGRPIVLVTLQYGLADAQQIDPLRAAIRRAGNDFAWWVRLHPLMGERREEVRAKLGTDLDQVAWLDEPSDLALPSLLEHADVHVTHSSSTVIEAEVANVPSILTSESGAEVFRSHVERGAACAVLSGVDGLLDAIRAARSQRPRASSQSAEALDTETFERAFELTSRGRPMPTPSR